LPFTTRTVETMKTTHYEIEDGHLSDALTARYADALIEEGIPNLPEEALLHVQDCTECKDKIIDVSIFLRNPDSSIAKSADRVKSAITDNTDNIVVMPGRKWDLYPLRIAAIFFVTAILLGTYFFVFRDGASFKEMFSNTGDTGQIKQAEEKPAVPGQKTSSPGETPANGAEKNGQQTTTGNGVNIVNPNLESMIDTRYRSSGIQIISPLNNTGYTAGSDIVFAWTPPVQGPLTLKIINNKNAVVYEYPLGVNGCEFVLKQNLPPGLYYWKLENQDDLLHIGKFFVKK